MPLRMYKLKPGASTRYRVSVPGSDPSSRLFLEASRPEEGYSVELELRLLDDKDKALAHGRVPLATGYLAVIKEVERQLVEVLGGDSGGEVWFELHHQSKADQLERNA